MKGKTRFDKLREKNVGTDAHEEANTERRKFLKYRITAIVAAALVGCLCAWQALAGTHPQTKKGQPVPKIEVLTLSWPQIIEFWRIEAGHLRKLGLEVKVTHPAIPLGVTKMFRKRDYGHIAGWAWGATPERIDPNFILEDLLHSRNAAKGRNIGYYINKEYDAIIEAQKAEMNPNKRRELLWKAQEILARDHPIYWYGFLNYHAAYNNRKWNITPMSWSGIREFSTISWATMQPKTEDKTLKCASLMSMPTLNTWAAPIPTERGILRQIYDTFGMVSADGKSVKPWAAESWKFIDDKTVDITLRQGMKFHDGKPVTVDDVKFTFDYLIKWKFPLWTQIWSILESAEIRDDRTVRVRLTAPYAPCEMNFLAWAHIIPKHIWEKVPEEVGVEHPAQYAAPPIGSGFMKFKSWKKGDELVLEAFKEHHHAVKYDGYIRKVAATTEGLVAMLETGEVDLIIPSGVFTTEHLKTLEGEKDVVVVKTPSHAVLCAHIDMREKPFSDLTFRRAIHHAMDSKAMKDIAWAGEGTVGNNNTPIHPNFFWFNPNIPYTEFSLDKAREILKEGGYTWDEKGRLCYPAE